MYIKITLQLRSIAIPVKYLQYLIIFFFLIFVFVVLQHVSVYRRLILVLVVGS